MGKTLIIAEKPSVATDLARVLGKVPKQGDWFENDELVISSAVGHLVELPMPEDIDKTLKRWSLENMPIVPKKWKLKAIEKNKKKFQELKKLINREDVERVVNACDAGREGELIFTYINELSRGKKPIARMWMSSMTVGAIKEAYANLREADEMIPLQSAARSRSEADWLVGINGTRGATIQFGRRGGTAATVGRVQTPTLSLVYQRELEIRDFKPRSYWKIGGRFRIAEGEYEGIYQKPDWKKGEDEHDRIDRLWARTEADDLMAALEQGKQALVTEEKKRTRSSSPRLFDLTSLQREANSRFGFPAGMTLNIAQSLYEKHKMLTYPRTDSRALPEDYGPIVKQTLANLEEPYAGYAGRILDENWVVTSNKRIFNNAQVSDHFAIIPTDGKPKKLKEEEQKIYDLVTRRFMAIFYPSAEFDVTTRLSKVGEHAFKTEGKVLVKPGWLEVTGKASTGDTILPPLTAPDGEPPKAEVLDLELSEDETRPPPRYSEATLLAAMEGAGKFIDDEELAEAMKEKGLGTPATRANIIDHLIREKYLERQGREISPTLKAEHLMKFLERFGIEELTSPQMTGEWEHRLRQVEEGKLSREEFMGGITDFTKKMIERLKNPPPAEKTDLPNPIDGSTLVEDHRGYQSETQVEVRGRKIPFISINKVIGNRAINREEIVTLLEKKEIGPLDGFRSRMGKAFSANLKLVEKDNGSWRVEIDFGGEGDGDGEEIDFSKFEKIAEWKDGTAIYETTNAYMTENYKREGRKETGFRLSRNMLGKPIVREQFLKLVNDGKTDLINGFRSNRTGRLFDAFLLLKEDGGIGFEFPPRKKTAKKKTVKKTAKKAAKKAPAAKKEES